MQRKAEVSMKKKLVLLAAVMAFLSVTVYGTLAYYVSSEDTQNIISSGSIKVKLHQVDADGNPFPEEGILGVMPSQVVAQTVYAENTGGNPQWVRIKIEKELIRADGEADDAAAEEYVWPDFEKDKWQQKDGWFYYTEPLAPQAKTEDLFRQIEFSGEMGNDYKKCTVYVNAEVQAVQSANNGSTVFEAAGWPEE